MREAQFLHLPAYFTMNVRLGFLLFTLQQVSREMVLQLVSWAEDPRDDTMKWEKKTVLNSTAGQGIIAVSLDYYNYYSSSKVRCRLK